MEGHHEAEPPKKPRHLTPGHAAAFRLARVAKHYSLRPPYPQAVIDRLRTDGVVLEMGCGTGEIARRLAPCARRVEAVDPSGAMIEEGRFPAGAGIEWVVSSAEDYGYPSRYDLIVTAQSLHWMDWEIVLPKFARALDGVLAILPDCRLDAPWRGEVQQIVPEFSTMKDFEPYDLVEELERRGLFRCEERVTLGPEPFRQSVDDYAASWWSRAGFARVDPKSAQKFASCVREIVEPHARDGWIEAGVVADLALGHPVD